MINFTSSTPLNRKTLQKKTVNFYQRGKRRSSIPRRDSFISKSVKPRSILKKSRKCSFDAFKENLKGEENIYESKIVIKKKPSDLITSDEFCVLVSPLKLDQRRHVYMRNTNVIKSPFGSFCEEKKNVKNSKNLKNYERKNSRKNRVRVVFSKLDENCSELTSKLPQFSNVLENQKKSEKKSYLTKKHRGMGRRKSSVRIARRLSRNDKSRQNSRKSLIPEKASRKSINSDSQKIINSSIASFNSRRSSKVILQRRNSNFSNGSNPLQKKISRKNKRNSCSKKPPKRKSVSKSDLKKLKKEIKSVKEEIKKTDEDIAIIKHSTISSVNGYKKFKSFYKQRKNKIKKINSLYKKLLLENLQQKHDLKKAYKKKGNLRRKVEKFKNSKDKEIQSLDLEMMKNRMLKKKVKEIEKKMKRKLEERIQVLEERTQKQLENEKIGLDDYYGNNSCVVKRELSDYIQILERRGGKIFGIGNGNGVF